MCAKRSRKVDSEEFSADQVTARFEYVAANIIARHVRVNCVASRRGWPMMSRMKKTMDECTGDRCLGSCPHVDRNDSRCGSRFSLGRLEQAFTVCFGSYHVCPMFHQINIELSAELPDRQPDLEPQPVVTVMNNECDQSLSATGT